ncbi:hypothetical protein K435DRAFT_565226, partial [Dendrothele bispora CBS 962.96]
NPLTPLALLPPSLAYDVQTTSYILVGIVGMFTWDLLTNLEGDYRLLTKFKVGLPTLTYFLSSIREMKLQRLTLHLEAGATVNCHTTTEFVKAFFFAGIGTTTLLFYLRVRAIYNDNKVVRLLFLFLWLANLCIHSLDFLFVNGVHLGPTDMCIFTDLKRVYAIVTATSIVIYDTMVFLAISYRLWRNSVLNMEEGVQSERGLAFDRTRTTSFFSGRGLPAFSKTLLQEGQVYYLISFFAALLVVVMLVLPGISDYYHVIMISPHIALVNSMACRVFRNVKL